MNRTFDPWIGTRYRDAGLCGRKVLVLGESHYGDAGTEHAATTINVVELLGRKKRHRFFTTTQRLLDPAIGDRLPTNDERAAFWEHVAFYNYIQCFVGPNARFRPTNAMWSAALEPFKSTLEELRPDAVLVLGSELGAKLLGAEITLPAIYVAHPSSWGFKVLETRRIVERALAS